MCHSDRLQEFLKRIMSEQEELGNSAERADHKCRKIYDRVEEIVREREALKLESQELNDEKERVEIQLKITRLDREFNDLLNILSMDSMEF